jgi:hypothetical protein
MQKVESSVSVKSQSIEACQSWSAAAIVVRSDLNCAVSSRKRASKQRKESSSSACMHVKSNPIEVMVSDASVGEYSCKSCSHAIKNVVEISGIEVSVVGHQLRCPGWFRVSLWLTSLLLLGHGLIPQCYICLISTV